MLRWLVLACWLCGCNQIFHIPDVKPSQDPCGDGLAKCDSNAACADTSNGDYTCTCNTGFTGDGKTCSDVDECSMSPAPCDVHATCTNTPGAYTCACDSGFAGDGTHCAPSTWQKLVAAGGFTCAIGGDGGLYCWGSNDFGQLGDGTFQPHARPAQIGTNTDWIDVGARYLKACGLRADHSMWCWGYGERGMLGDGQMKTSPVPVQVVSDKPGVGFKSLAVGKWDVCGIHDDGSLACWGLDRITNMIVAKPVAVDTNTDWTQISAGTVMCGLRNTTGGNLYCWGKSQAGTYDLGMGTTTTSVATPTKLGTDTWREVSMGYYNACAIRADGTLWCWGNCATDPNVLQYGAVPVEVSANTDWTAISMSIDTVGGIRGGGTAYVWGDNETGQLGEAAIGEFPNPVPIGGTVTGWTSIIAGNSHTCGISSGKGYCWGAIGDGDLGNGAAVIEYVPTKIGTSTYSAIASASAKCAIGSGGDLDCWGESVVGVGFGNTDPVWVPTKLGTDTWTAVDVSVSFPLTACGIHGGGVLSCWGDNTNGQVGIGNQTTPQLSPVPVQAPAGTVWTQVATSDHTCAITNASLLFCWGIHATGALGDGTTGQPPVTAPPSTPLPNTWLHVSVAPNGATMPMTCAVRSDHTLWCWGQDLYPNTTERDVPTQIGTDTDWATVSTSGLETCGVKVGGTLWCSGQYLGDGTANMSATMQRVGTDTNWASISAGQEMCGVKTDHTLWCFGNQYGSPLGNGKEMTDFTTQLPPTALSPTQIGSDTDWAAIASVGDSCGIKTDGSLWCWGYGAAAIPQYVSVPTPID